MPRPKKYRIVEYTVKSTKFSPESPEGSVKLNLDEVEAMRLMYIEKMYQEKAAGVMGVSRQTFGRILRSSLEKMTDALVNSKEIKIGENEPDREIKLVKCENCGKVWRVPMKDERKTCPFCKAGDLHVSKKKTD